MLRAVRIWNTSADEVTIGSSQRTARTIPPLGSLVVTHAAFVEMATENDLGSLPIRVTLPREGLRRASVKDFGAKGDGVTDDTDAVQAAIDYVTDYGGGVVDVPIGVYLVGPLYISGDVSLEGESKYASVLKQVGEGAAISVSAPNASLSKLRIIGSGTWTNT